jgi:hypothetical protein
MTSEAQVRGWMEETIIGLDLCPWARPVWERGGVHLAFTRAATPTAALDAFLDEHLATAAHPQRETVLLVFERWHLPFELFWEMVSVFEEHTLPEWQLVAFHPQFRFEGASAADPANGVNRAPFPTVQWLRRSDVAAATQRDPRRAEALSQRNGRRLAGLSPTERRRHFPWE